MGYTGQQKRDYQLAWMKRRRDEWIAAQGGKCAKCGSTDGLEVDHIDPMTKSMNPAQIWSRKATDRIAELAKCQVLCAICHLVKTVAHLSTSEHGTRSRYDRGCRCSDCTAAAAEGMRAWRAKRRLNTAPA